MFFIGRKAVIYLDVKTIQVPHVGMMYKTKQGLKLGLLKKVPRTHQFYLPFDKICEKHNALYSDLSVPLEGWAPETLKNPQTFERPRHLVHVIIKEGTQGMLVEYPIAQFDTYALRKNDYRHRNYAAVLFENNQLCWITVQAFRRYMKKVL